MLMGAEVDWKSSWPRPPNMATKSAGSISRPMLPCCG